MAVQSQLKKLLKRPALFYGCLSVIAAAALLWGYIWVNYALGISEHDLMQRASCYEPTFQSKMVDLTRILFHKKSSGQLLQQLEDKNPILLDEFMCPASGGRLNVVPG